MSRIGTRNRPRSPSPVCNKDAKKDYVEINKWKTKKGFKWDEIVEVITEGANHKVKYTCEGRRSEKVECSDGDEGCPGISCKNRKIVDNIPKDNRKYYLDEVEGKGKGLYAKGPIEKGTFLGCYFGEVITKKEYLKRKMKHSLSSFNYTFELHGGHFYSDARHYGSDLRFANHSCKGNCTLQLWIKNGEPRLIIVASRNIVGKEEITYTYCQNVESVIKECQCRTVSCDERQGIPTNPLRCVICPRVSGSKKMMEAHMRFHTGERPFKCSKCEKAFHIKCNLTAHMRTHRKENAGYMNLPNFQPKK